MTRQFRPYGKKRGQRRTGSRRLGSLAEAVFFLFFFGVGASGLTLMLTRFAVPEWRVNHDFVWWMWLMLILPASFVIIGAAGVLRAMLQSSTSTERRAALARKASQLDLFDDAQQRGSNHPQVPRVDSVTDSPGTRLAYRLPLEMSSGWTLLGTALLCLFWNAVVVWAGVRVIRDHLAGRSDVLASLVLVFFASAGLVLSVHFVRKLLVTTGMGATRVEVSGHPLFPGMRYQVFLSQAGRLRVNSFEALLVCSEEAVYRQGTDTRIATECVYQQPFFRQESFLIRPGRAFEDMAEVQVPDDAMHSFQSDHNEVKWRLMVRADVAGWPEYQRSFPVVIYPLPERSRQG